MNFRFVLILLTCLFVSLGAHHTFAREKNSLTLADCFHLAKAKSETIGMSEQDIKFARAHYQNVLGHVLPVIQGNGSDILQDTSGVTPATGINSNQTRFSRPAASVSATQPIFQGFQDVHALKQASLAKKQSEFDLKETERSLLAEVAQTFSQVARSEREMETTKKILGVGNASLKQLGQDNSLGKARNSEFKSLQAQVALLTSDLRRMEGDHRAATERLAYLTGLDAVPHLNWEAEVRRPLKPLSDYLAGVPARPDLKSAELATAGAKQETKLRKGALLPQAAVSANYYGYRTGFQKDINWDATFNLTVPLINVSNFAQIREAKASQIHQSLKEAQAKRLANSDIKSLYETAQALRAQWKELALSERLSNEAYQLQTGDYHNGLTTQRDVLLTMQTWMETLRSRDTVELDAWLAAVNLMIAAGENP